MTNNSTRVTLCVTHMKPISERIRFDLFIYSQDYIDTCYLSPKALFPELRTSIRPTMILLLKNNKYHI